MNDQLNPKIWKLFQEVVVPAVLGNTAWALASLTVEFGISETSIPKIISLVVITTLFIWDWYGGVETPIIKSNIRFTVVSSIFYSAIVVFAIATVGEEEPGSVSRMALICFFATTAIGQLLGAWKRVDKPRLWVLFTISNVLLFALVFEEFYSGLSLLRALDFWTHPVALLIYLAAWSTLWFKRKSGRKWE